MDLSGLSRTGMGGQVTEIECYTTNCHTDFELFFNVVAMLLSLSGDLLIFCRVLCSILLTSYDDQNSWSSFIP